MGRRPKQPVTPESKVDTAKITLSTERTKMKSAEYLDFPPKPTHGDKYYDMNREVTIVYNEKLDKWCRVDTSIKEPMTYIDNLPTGLLEFFSSNSYVDGKRISDSEFEVEVSKFLQKVKILFSVNKDKLNITVTNHDPNL